MKSGGAIIFAVTFLAAMLVTIGWSEFPPGRELVGLLGISEADSSGMGMQILALLAGSLNGIVYGGIALMIFTLATWAPTTLSRDKQG